MRNLCGEYIVTPELIADELIQSCNIDVKLEVKPDTNQGFVLYTGDGILKSAKSCFYGVCGFYSIHNESSCLYVGKSDVSIGMRISRFVKEVQGKSRFDEAHPAAKKYRAMWGSDVSGLSVRVYPCIKQDNIVHTEIEKNLIRMLNPVLNSKGRK